MNSVQPARVGGSTTWLSLIERARAGEQEAWNSVVALYAPLVHHECRAMGIASQDASDIVQDVFVKVSRGLASFRRDRPGDSFRAWLATIARNCIRDHYKKNIGRPRAVGGSEMHRRIHDMPEGPSGESTISSGPKTNTFILHRAMRLVQDEFEPRTWEAFRRVTLEGVPAAEVAAQLGVARDVVYQAKSRVLRRLRQAVEGLLE
jgi:RNA polymerase sigma-70 factor (ECF subfamily)